MADTSGLVRYTPTAVPSPTPPLFFTKELRRIGQSFTTAAEFLQRLGTAAFLDTGTSAGNVVVLNGSAKLPAVDGSLLTNVVSTNPNFYNVVTDGGVDNTGATDCVTALNAALTAAVAAKKTIYMPAGTYKWSNAATYVTVPSGANIIGEGPFTVCQRTVDPVASPMFWVEGNDISMDHLYFQYTPAGYGTPSATGGPIYCRNSTRCTFSRLRATGGFYVVFFTIDSSDVSWRDCYTSGYKNRGFYIGAGIVAGGVVRDVQFYSCHADGSSVADYGFNTNGFGVGTGENIVFEGCTVRNTTAHGFGLSERIYGSKLSGCRTYGVPVAFLIQTANTYANEKTTLTNCEATDATIGFEVLGSFYTTLVNCQAWSASNHGFFLEDSQFVNFVSCSAVLCGGDGFNAAATSSGAAQHIGYTACVASSNTGWGFNTDANTPSVVTNGCHSIVNTAGTYNILGAGSATAVCL